MSHKKVLMTVTTSALVASAFVGTEEAKAASHEVEQGDTLWAIAQEHDISVQDLRKWNELKSDLIFPGQILQLAGPKEDNSSTQEVETNQSDDTTYIVKSGDTLSHIALSYNVSIADLMAWNNLQSTLIFPGNVLLVKDDVTQTESIDYTVRAGDTLSQIALKHGVTVAQLAKWNNITNPNLILINQKLTIHLPTEEKVEETTQPEVEEEVTEPEAEVEEETTEPEAEVEEEVTEPEAELEEEVTEPEAELEEETTEPEAEVEEEVTEPEAEVEEEVTEPEAELEEEVTEPEAEVEEDTTELEAEVEEDTTEPEAEVKEEKAEPETEVEEETTEPEAEVKEEKAEPETEVEEETTELEAEVKEESKEVTVAPANNNETVYKVVAGDSLSKIAREFGMSAKAVADRNGIETSKVLHINDELIVNKKKEQAAPKPQAQAKPETKPETQAKPETKPEVKPKPQVKPKPEAKPQPKPQAQSSGFDVNRLMSSARSAIGTPYVWGASNPGKAFDCSGFIHWAYNDAGKQMSRTSTDGYYARSYHINKSDLQVGDLVFFKGTYRAGISHMGIYAGNNNFIHAGSSTGVTVTSLDNSYWKKHFDSFKRFN